MHRINIGNRWDDILRNEFAKQYFIDLLAFVNEERKVHTIFPPQEVLFNAFTTTSFDNVKVVIIGQDPYHGPGQAHGLSFSVPPKIPIPRSLKNIFKELNTDLQLPIPKHGNLEKWAAQGVLLLNTILTVRENTPKSHHKRGWEIFTDTVIRTLSENKSNLVFLLWGNDAQQKIPLIDASKHCILTAAHPSPLSASRGFFGCRHFSKTNQWLQKTNQTVIDWEI